MITYHVYYISPTTKRIYKSLPYELYAYARDLYDRLRLTQGSTADLWLVEAGSPQERTMLRLAKGYEEIDLNWTHTAITL